MTRKSWDAGSSSSSSTSTSNFNSSIPSSPTHLDSLQHSSWPGNTSTSLAVSGVGSGRESGGSGGGGGDRTISSYANGGLIKNIRESIGSALVMSLKSAGGIGGINPGSQRQLGGEFVLESCGTYFFLSFNMVEEIEEEENGRRTKVGEEEKENRCWFFFLTLWDWKQMVKKELNVLTQVECLILGIILR